MGFISNFPSGVFLCKWAALPFESRQLNIHMGKLSDDILIRRAKRIAGELGWACPAKRLMDLLPGLAGYPFRKEEGDFHLPVRVVVNTFGKQLPDFQSDSQLLFAFSQGTLL